MNWSGYADLASARFTHVSASWTVPTIACQGKENDFAVFWVGVDGFTNSTIEQAGTASWCYEDTAYAEDCWELYPTNDIQSVNPVAPGDASSASVDVSGSTYTLSVTDTTNEAASFTTTPTCSTTSCQDASVE